MRIDQHSPADKPDTEEMKVIHKALRRELDLLGPVIAAVPADDRAAASAVAKHADLMLAMLHEHHESEDRYLWPLLHERLTLDDSLIDTMEEQHEALAKIIASVEPDLPEWAATATARLRDHLAARFRELATALREHLDLEEQRVLPLIREQLSVAEWKEPQKAAMRNLPGDFRSRMLLAGVVLEDATPVEHRWFLHEMPAPARLIWRVVGARLYTAHVRAVRLTG
ncbi:hemerythrin domain-containing protein [Amycolatopsis sp. NPDC051045]|uniref:hemerythrin domain-containing protein n=1 Tax=Amycolatopsis sp. NPDC051045 TaxID=3156922 RepID=UPI00342746A4